MSTRLLAFLAAFALVPSYAVGQPTAGAQSTLIDPSIRAWGMGRAGVAVFWGGDPNQWVNPSLLGYHEGIRYQYGKTKLLPELSDDIFFKSDVFTVGGYGVGVYMAGKPVGRLRLDYGTIVATDVDGNEIGEFSAFEDIEAFGVGLSVAQLAESVLRAVGKAAPPLSRFGDVSLGHTWKDLTLELPPATLGSTTIKGEGKNRDHGLLVRMTPYNSIDYPGLWPQVESTIRARVDVSYGTAAVNYDNDATVSYGGQIPADPFGKISNWGWAVHADLTLASLTGDPTSEKQRWLSDLFSPLISFGWTTEHAQPAVQDVKYGDEADLEGWELGFANVVTIRHGHMDDPTTIVGDTSGWGVGFRVGKLGGFRWDHATVPRTIEPAENLDREGFTVFLDPVRIYQRFHHTG